MFLSWVCCFGKGKKRKEEKRKRLLPAANEAHQQVVKEEENGQFFVSDGSKSTPTSAKDSSLMPPPVSSPPVIAVFRSPSLSRAANSVVDYQMSGGNGSASERSANRSSNEGSRRVHDQDMTMTGEFTSPQQKRDNKRICPMPTPLRDLSAVINETGATVEELFDADGRPKKNVRKWLARKRCPSAP